MAACFGRPLFCRSLHFGLCFDEVFVRDGFEVSVKLDTVNSQPLELTQFVDVDVTPFVHK